MKKPIIKNWIKYFTGTLAVSGMLVVGGCDNNSNDRQETTNETQTEASENGVGQPTRDNVSQNVETDTYDNNEDAGQATATNEQAQQDNQPQYDQMSNRSSAPRAQGISNIDNHLEEHSEANREITETLTERENLENGEAAGIHLGETTNNRQMATDGQMTETDRNTYDRQSNTDFEDEGNDTMNRQQEMEAGQQGATGTNEPTQQRNTLDNEQDANMGRQSTTQQGQSTEMGQDGTTGTTYDRQSNTDFEDTDNNRDQQGTQGIPEEGETYQGRDSEAQVGTNRQGTTQMTMDRDQQGNTPQRDENSPMEQQQGMGIDTDNQSTTTQQGSTDVQHRAEAGEDNARYENDGDDPTRTGINEQDRASEYGNQAQGQNTQTNIGTESNDYYQEGDNNQSGTNRQGTTTNNQGNSTMNQDGAQHRAEASEDDPRYENDGDDPTRTGINEQDRASEYGNQAQGQNTQTNIGTESNDYYQEGDNNQSGTSQQEDGTGVIIYERYSVTYPESYSDEDRQRTEDIMNEYETRRESMRGQMNEENGAYMAPEVDAEPREGYDQLMSQIQENLNYPQDAAAAEIEGTIFVNFVVDENGNIEDARAVEDVVVPPASLRSATNPLDPTKFHEEEIEEIKEEMRQAAVEAVEATSGQWTPGQQGGENVRSEVQIPVRFVMENNRANTIPDGQ